MRILTAATTSHSSTRRSFAWTVPALAATLALAGFCAALPAAQAAPLAAKQAQAAQLDREVAKLEDEYADLAERYRGSLVDLQKLQRSVRTTQAELAATRADLDEASDRLRVRALAVYRDGAGSSKLLDVARAGSVADFFERVDMIERVGNQDATILGRVETLERQVQKKELILRTARTRQAKVVKRASSSKRRMGSVLGKKRAALGSVTAEIRAIMEQQRAAEALRQEAASRAAVQQLQAGTSAPTGTITKTAPDGTTVTVPAPSPDASTGSDASATAAPAAPISVPLPPASGSASSAAGIAMGKTGSPYVYGAAGPSSFDCSGLVVWAFAQAGRPGLPHSTYSLIGMGVEVPMAQAQVGDLIFTNNAGHMGIYVGGGSMVHAPRTGRTVSVESLSNYTIVAIRRI
jgi:cell wall-associated NlpC family hydrolase